MKQYSKFGVELVATLKKCITSNLMDVSNIKSEPQDGVFVVNIEGHSPSETKKIMSSQ